MGELIEVRPGIHAWLQADGSWWLNNAGAVSTADGQLVVDTCATETRARRFLETLRAATGQAPKLAVNTHQHGDHTYGNCLLPAATVLIGQENMREGLRVDPIIDGCPPFWSPVPDWGDVTRRLPDLTVTGAMTVHLGDRRIELRHPGGPAHTTGDLIAWVPDARVLFTGDLVFAGLTPLVFMGSVTGALAAVDWLAGLAPEVIVPGHGPILEGADIARVLDEHRRYYHLVLDAGAAGIADGRPPLDAARAVDLGEFAGWADAERLVLNLHRYYADHHGTDLDLIAAFSDAVAYHGGPLPTRV
ncbi:beta-lactamase [Actinoplanes sp. SE50]|uniref:MBL fold metallo-hydrolase n=1 Tax=unclassified Actinoplanes TaxID=2626549 RepID=UPI00023EC441|nr:MULTISPECIES: MBL fold metallo-hydrolase [unclassified Actinoplanes]AEV83609.1 beta-lactamase domain protein [Actinoplanes sp. SE50/110]ATO82247.1 beta-lactamase [Actinoplanes sp. SE50]SLL99654.1 MBL fold metallo-hydrolase [Actinoplanes sp. SE50/110]